MAAELLRGRAQEAAEQGLADNVVEDDIRVPGTASDGVGRVRGVNAVLPDLPVDVGFPQEVANLVEQSLPRLYTAD